MDEGFVLDFIIVLVALAILLTTLWNVFAKREKPSYDVIFFSLALVVFGAASLLASTGVLPSSFLPFIAIPLVVAALVYGFFYMKRRATNRDNL
ncbi:MAG: hypothetical protein J0I20_09710 [Chloroflexi bacterium]|nr:hypothetical protein [Chloroflexota bacterium]OJV94621.1 MAG: hypothetical protein BGO39_23105 [Chloroflexi bacterium 54-19]